MTLAETNRWDASIRLLHEVCRISHPTQDFLSAGSLFSTPKLQRALREGNNPAIYDWLMGVFSYQGVADKAVETIIARDGNATWASVEESLKRDPGCMKLQGFWRFESCGFSKTHRQCNCAHKFATCPLPRLPLRNGSLNQLAYSLYFFFRDVADGDFLGWLDTRVSAVAGGKYPDIERELIAPLRAVHGISDKVISMALSDLLMVSPDPSWRRLGAEFIVVDRLIHNFMHRSGILRRHGCDHLYGPGCYSDAGCARLLLSLSRGIDMRRYHHAFPQPFPRFVQTAIWRYCAASGENICNGNMIDDDHRCQNDGCDLQSFCARIRLRKRQKVQ
jgi:hypothetical protein